MPYHGGPGNNYVTHAIAAIVEGLRLRRAQGNADLIPSIGMVCANGGFLSKHAVGIYSTQPPSKCYRRRNPKDYADSSNSLPLKAYSYKPNGVGRILAWTVDFQSKPNKPKKGMIIGELIESTGPDCAPGQRFIAITARKDLSTINWLLETVHNFFAKKYFYDHCNLI